MTHSVPHSETLFERAQKVIPGGVNSPVRAFKGVGGTPVFFKGAKGAYVFDEDNNEYLDFVQSWGPMILGHNAPEIVSALHTQLDKAISFGAPTELEIEMAEEIVSIFPSIDKVRMVNSGTEATMTAIRLARGFTNRDKIVKFEGCYHGHADSLLVKAGSGMLTLGVPTSPGVPASMAEHTITLDFNNVEQLKEVFADIGDQIACIIVEPIAGNMNLIPASEEFLQAMRDVCDQSDSVLIFDEVMSGFRASLKGVQGITDVKPDLVCLGKVIGGGLPVGAFGGNGKIMDYMAPVGPVYQAGTLSGNPLAMAAGLTMLKAIQADGFYAELTRKTKNLLLGLQQAANDAGIAFTTQQRGSMFGLFFTQESEVVNFKQITECNGERFNQFFHFMLEEGVYLAPSSFEAGFMSAAHTDADIEKAIAAATIAFSKL
jgi:glutamate-1-semialdehyde 2,1-aminomutase